MINPRDNAGLNMPWVIGLNKKSDLVDKYLSRSESVTSNLFLVDSNQNMYSVIQLRQNTAHKCGNLSGISYLLLTVCML